PGRDRVVVFGGGASGYLDDTWVLDTQSGSVWEPLATQGAPPPARRLHTAIYDAANPRMIVLAGYDGASSPSLRRSDVWALSLDADPTWSEITPAVAGPSARSSLDAAYDAARQRVVLFGGT